MCRVSAPLGAWVVQGQGSPSGAQEAVSQPAVAPGGSEAARPNTGHLDLASWLPWRSRSARGSVGGGAIMWPCGFTEEHFDTPGSWKEPDSRPSPCCSCCFVRSPQPPPYLPSSGILEKFPKGTLISCHHRAPPPLPGPGCHVQHLLHQPGAAQPAREALANWILVCQFLSSPAAWVQLSLTPLRGAQQLPSTSH